MIDDFDEPSGDQAADPFEAAWELWNDLRRRPEFRELTMSQWACSCAPVAATLIGQGWTVEGLYGQLTARLPQDGFPSPVALVAKRLNQLRDQEGEGEQL